MQKNRKKLILIIILLIAVTAVALGVSHTYKSREVSAAEQKNEPASEQVTGDSSEQAVGGEAETAGSEEQEQPVSDGTNQDSGPLATLFFASDYQAEPGFDEPSVTLSSILAAAETDGKSIERVVMCGDYTNDRVLHDYQLSPDESIAEIFEVVSEKCPAIGIDKKTGVESNGATDTKNVGVGEEASAVGNTVADENEAAVEKAPAAADILFVQGNHDRLTEQITPTGLHEYENYLIYVLNTEEDFPWKQGKTAGCLAKVRASSAAMKKCFDELIKRGETRPVFIAGHVPLHFTARTSSLHTTGDNLYSSLIFNVVNEAAKSLDIVYLFGHNHSKGWDCYIGGSSVYKAKSDTILIPVFSDEMINTDEYSKEKLEFTYMNAGYTGYYMNCGTAELDAGTVGEYHAADETLTGTVFEIFDDRIVITRYDADGVHALGHAGEADPYKGGIDEGLIPEEEYSRETAGPQQIPRESVYYEELKDAA